MILITGANGLVGSALMKELYDNGVRKLRILLYKDEEFSSILEDESLKDLEIEFFRGDVRDKESIKDIMMTGVTELYHLAALISIVPGMYSELYQTNVEGTKNVIELAIKNNVKKVVYISSVEAIGYKDGENDIDETVGFRPNNCFIEYGKSKALAALNILDLARKAKLDLFILAPVGILGPYDYLCSRVGKMIWDTSREKLPAYIDGSFDFVDSRDVARACYLAMKKGKSYETYILSTKHLYIENIVNIVTEKLNVKKPPKLGMFLVRILAFFFELSYKLFGGQPLITSGSLAMTQVHVRYSAKKAKEELGWVPKEMKDTILDTYYWYKEHESKVKFK